MLLVSYTSFFPYTTLFRSILVFIISFPLLYRLFTNRSTGRKWQFYNTKPIFLPVPHVKSLAIIVHIWMSRETCVFTIIPLDKQIHLGNKAQCSHDMIFFSLLIALSLS